MGFYVLGMEGAAYVKKNIASGYITFCYLSVMHGSLCR
jgi:hypothetical protein